MFRSASVSLTGGEAEGCNLFALPTVPCRLRVLAEKKKVPAWDVS
jgi:hypothetical protein